MAAKLLFTLICEDARVETTNKLILLGVFNYLINFLIPPGQNITQVNVAMPKLCIVRRWSVDAPGHKARTELRDPAGKVLLTWERELEMPNDQSYFQEIMQILGPIFTNGTYKIVTTFDPSGPETNEECFDVRIVEDPSLLPSQLPNQPISTPRG